MLPGGLLPDSLLVRLPSALQSSGPLLPTHHSLPRQPPLPPSTPLSPPPPPLDFALLTYPYMPTWNVLRRMQSSELPTGLSARESVVDLGAFFDEDSESDIEAGECDALRPAGKRARELQLQCAGPVRALLLFCVLVLFAFACVAHLKRTRSPLRFVRDRV